MSAARAGETTTTLVAADAWPPGADRPSRAPVVVASGPPVRATLAGLLVGAVSYGLAASGVLPGVVLWCAALALLGLMPSSRWLSRRVAVNGVVAMAVVPALWWFSWPVAVDHGALALAAAGGGLAWWVVHGEVSTRLRVLRPRATRVDALVPLTGLLTVVAMHGWWLTASPRQALTLLLGGYDNSAHFDIFSRLLSHHALLDYPDRAPDGSEYSLTTYPQGFHTLAGSYAEMAAPGTTTGPSAVLVYAHAIAAVIVLGMVVLSAAVCSLPGLRARVLVAAPTVTVVCALFLWGPGEKMLGNGFSNFWLAAVAAACTLMLAIDTAGRTSALRWAAIGSGLVVVAHTWAPLLLLALPALMVALPDRSCRASASRRTRMLTALVAVATVLGVLRAVLMLMQQAQVEVTSLVTAKGAITNPSPLPTLILIPLSLLVFLEFGYWVRRSPRLQHHAFRAAAVRRLSLAVASGAVSLAGLLVLQLRSGGVAYYFFKYLVGFELVIGAITAAAAGVCLALCAPPARQPRWALTVSVVACLLATQAFGAVGWRDLLGSPQPPGTHGTATTAHRSTAASGILAAAGGLTSRTEMTTDYLAPTDLLTQISPSPPAWVHAISGGMTERQNERLRHLVPLPVDGEQLAACARRVLGADPGAHVMVQPDKLPALRARLGPRWGSRVTSWNAG